MFLRRDLFGELWSDLNRVQHEMNRLISQRGVSGSQPMTIWADEHTVYAEVDLPDLDPNQLEVTVTEGNELTIMGERHAPKIEGAVWVRQERPFGQFRRNFTLPVLVDADKVEAQYANGVLKLTLPKSEAAKPRKITVKA